MAARLKVIRLWAPVVAWCGFIFYLSSLPSLSTGLGVWDFLIRKLAHISEYCMLAILFFRALKGTFVLKPKAVFACACALTFLYAVSDEYHQTFVAGRSGNIPDVMIDSIGIVLFYFLYKYAFHQSRMKKIIDFFDISY